MIVDTTLLIDLEREIARRQPGPAVDLLVQGDNDLWIGATALELGEPLVTRDHQHFSRIAGLTVIGY